MTCNMAICNLEVLCQRSLLALRRSKYNLNAVKRVFNRENYSKFHFYALKSQFVRHFSVVDEYVSKRTFKARDWEEVSHKKKSPKHWFDDVVALTKVLNSREWEELKNKAETELSISMNNFESQIMFVCALHGNYSLGHSLMNWIRMSNKTPNLVTLAKYLRLCANSPDECDEEAIIEAYEEIRKRQSVFDVLTVSDIVYGLCRTKRWRESLSYIDSVSITNSSIPPNIYECLIMASFTHGDHEYGCEQFEKLLSKNPDRHVDDLLLKWMDAIRTSDESDQKLMVERLFGFLRDHYKLVSRTIAEELKFWFEGRKDEEWNGTFTENTRGGNCQNCGSALENIQLSDSDFEKLRSSFSSKVIEGPDIYLKTNPYELEKFKRFVAKTAPYSVVIDGLNIAFAQSKRSISSAHLAEQLLKAVVQLNQNGNASRKPMILGRHHMGSWPKHIMKQINELCHLFFADNLSKDDPFMIYAAMYSGQGTFFVSKDMLRDHLFCLEDNELKTLFRRWQKGHQLELLSVNPFKPLRFKTPLRHNHAVQMSSSGWHVPYDDGNDRYSYETPNLWLCLLRNGNFNKSTIPRVLSGATNKKPSRFNVKNIFKE